MFHANELVMFIIGLGTLLFIFSNHDQLRRLPSSNILLGSFYVLVLSWFLTVIEGYFFEELFNFMEHALYSASSILLAIWCWKIFHSKRQISS